MEPQNRRWSERRTCWVQLLDVQDRALGKIGNISASGVLLETELDLRQSSIIAGSLRLPTSAEALEVPSELVWQKPSADGHATLAGLRFVDLSTTTKRCLQEYLATSRVNDLLKVLQKDALVTEENLKPIGDTDEIRHLLEAVKASRSTLRIFWCNGRVSISTVIRDLGSTELLLDISDLATDTVKSFDHVFAQLQVRDRCYYFEVVIKSIDSLKATTTVPDVLFFSERRVESRQPVSQRDRVLLTAISPNNAEIVAQVIDLNSSGVSLKLAGAAPYRLEAGETLNGIRVSGASTMYPSATVVYVALEESEEQVRRVGIKFDVVRKPYDFHRLDFVKADHKAPRATSTQQAVRVDPVINVVRYYNDRNEELVAILNSTTELRDRVAMPVVVIPPALGRRKETLGPLALMVVETFKKNGKDVAVIRYDGVRTVGESYNDRECRSPGREMLNFTMSQSIEDLLTTLDFLETHDRLRCTEVVVLAFSMVSIIARRAIVRDTKRRIGLCINIMGSTDVEDFLFNATGGLDCLRDYRAGLQDGAFQVLGCLMKRAMLGDILDHQMAYIQPARQDMAKIDIPISWISGTYDYWTNQKRVEDIMSVASPSTRVLYEVPTGHIVKTSDEAMQVFDLIVRIMWQHLFQSTVTPVRPDPDLAKRLNVAEWERVKRTSIDSKAYWKQYLLDKEEGKVGYDVLTFADDYNDFLDTQVDLLRLGEGDIVADIGGGTGSFLKFYLDRMSKPRDRGTPGPVKSILVVDLVWEALCKAKAKHQKFGKASESLGVAAGFVVADTDIEGRKFAVPFKDESFSKILASLLVSYLRNPQGLVDECYRLLRPNGLILISSLKPDADMSKPITHLIGKIKQSDDLIEGISKEEFLASAQSFMNLAASLFDLEEEKVFKFYTSVELRTLLERAGFRKIEICESFGDPPQALVALAQKTS